ncbi:MAG: hypothetical protein F6K56_00500 [Moorea sp. SIO3G5]|nr:hypothetical protein [Moorena sp. SIO3G5]
MGILVEWASFRCDLWNEHLLGATCGMGILVEWASWWNGHLGGMGILVERASWWNGHLARYNTQHFKISDTPMGLN